MTSGTRLMSQITRRDALTGAAALTSAGALGSLRGTDVARAAAPLSGKQNSGWYRYKVGEFEITVVTDGATLR